MSDQVLFVFVLAATAVILFLLANERESKKLLSQYIDPRDAIQIWNEAFRLGLEIVINQAAKTPTEIDDKQLIALAQSRGYGVFLVDGDKLIVIEDGDIDELGDYLEDLNAKEVTDTLNPKNPPLDDTAKQG